VDRQQHPLAAETNAVITVKSEDVSTSSSILTHHLLRATSFMPGTLPRLGYCLSDEEEPAGTTFYLIEPESPVGERSKVTTGRRQGRQPATVKAAVFRKISTSAGTVCRQGRQ
jgi:hypothetical protein